MSEISDAARVQIFLADHGVADPINKINALGVGFQVMALQANGFTAPCAVLQWRSFRRGSSGMILRWSWRSITMQMSS